MPSPPSPSPSPSPSPTPSSLPSRPAEPSPRLDVAGPDAALAGGTWVGDTSGSRVRRPGWAREADAAEAEVEAKVGAEAGSGVAVGAGPSRRERLGLAVRERLPMWLQTRCGLERRAVVALVVVLGVAAVFAAQHFWTGRAQPVRPPDVVRAAGAVPERGAEPVPSPGPPAQAGRTSADAGGGAAGAVAGGGGAAGAIVVDVSGKVRRPGVHRLPAGSRVADALRAAGGVRPGTETDDLNRARFLVDGEQVVVGGPSMAAGAGAGAGAGTGSPGTGVGAGAGPAGAAATGPVGLNTATAEQLDELPGVGPVLAQHILDYRAEHGGFRSVEELREVNGIGDRRFADLQDLVRP
ncbi:helix-hairpin-helix domain-containing protein [Streptomyces atriruber]|uniref:helix-hairpin-helix domain-containing protein n=1 Tax=Streptomyces atriruber TaxID=545121 RepID=UPI003F540C95